MDSLEIDGKSASAPRALDYGFQGFEFGQLSLALTGVGKLFYIILIASNVRIRLGRIEASFILHSTLTDIL